MQNTTPSPSFASQPRLSPEDLRRQLAAWNKTEAAYPLQCLHELFESQVQRTPTAIAVMSEDEHISYERCNQQANQVARYVRKVLEMDATNGSKTTGPPVGAEPRVALFVSHSSPLVLVGFWGILNAGGTVVLV